MIATEERKEQKEGGKEKDLINWCARETRVGGETGQVELRVRRSERDAVRPWGFC